jgi:redox-sensitive bicupin YhaK (pirin superfamily)
VLPGIPGATPGYAQKDFSANLEEGGVVLLVSPDGADGSISINQDCRIFGARLKTAGVISQSIADPRHGWVQVISGEVVVNGGTELSAGDACALAGERSLKIEAKEAAELLIFDLV